MFAVYPISQVRETYQLAYNLSQDHDAACIATADALGIEVQSVRDALAIEGEAS